MLIRIGNFLFYYRNFLFPLALPLVLVPGPRIFTDPVDALLLGFLVTAAGQVIRATTIGFKYIVRGGKKRRIYASGLVTDGIYACTRNPMYVGNVLVVGGIALACNSWPAVATALPLCLFVYTAIISAEEAYLRREFGTAFDEYCRDVPRWLPRLSGLAAAFGSLDFRWRRVIVKEYGTPFAWISAMCVIGGVNLWRAGRLGIGEPVVRVLVVVWAATAALWALVRVLKKTKTLVAN